MLLLLGTAPPGLALDNGLAWTPPMGWSSWYAAPAGSQVTSAFMRNQTTALVHRGLAAKGYVYVNVDEGWLKGRYANGTIYEDFEKVSAILPALAVKDVCSVVSCRVCVRMHGYGRACVSLLLADISALRPLLLLHRSLCRHSFPRA
jgi:hypothetical protein